MLNWNSLRNRYNKDEDEEEEDNSFDLIQQNNNVNLLNTQEIKTNNHLDWDKLRNQTTTFISNSDYDPTSIKNTLNEIMSRPVDNKIQEIVEDDISENDYTKNIDMQEMQDKQDNIETEKSEKRKEIFNVIANGKKPTNLMTDEEKELQKYKTQQNIKYNQEAKSDKNILSQIGKTIENLFLGITGGGKSFAYYAADPQHTSKQETELLAGNNSDIGILYKAEKKENEVLNKPKDNSAVFLMSEHAKKEKNVIPSISKETESNINNIIEQNSDAFGDIEINSFKRNLSKDIAKDQEKINTNVNKINNPIIKKVAELAPSTGNSLVGAGLSMVNPWLGMQYFVISAAGSYEFEGRNRGMSKEEARDYGTIMGTMEGLTEQLEVSYFVPKFIKTSSTGQIKEFFKNVGLDMADNAIQEAVIDPIDEITAKFTSGKTKYDYSDKTGWQQLVQDMAVDGINGALSSVLMGGITGGIGSSIRLYDKIKNGENITSQELGNALSDIQKSKKINIKEKFKEAFNFQKDELNNTENKYTITTIDNEGNIISFKEAMGEKIKLENNKLDIEPIVAYVDGYYNIIDGKTGLKLDTSLYESKENAINSFKNIISNIDDATIKDINNKSTMMQLNLIDKLSQMQEQIQRNPEEAQKQTRLQLVEEDRLYSTAETQEIFNQFNISDTVNNRQYLGQEINQKITDKVLNATKEEINIQKSSSKENNENEKTYTRQQFENISKLVTQISNNAEYNKENAIEVFKTVGNNIKNIEIIEQDGNTYVNSLNKDGSVAYQQKINKRIYTGEKIKDIINNSINNADLSNINLADNVNTNSAQTSTNKNTDNLNIKVTSYTPEKVKTIIEPFSNQKEYTVEEMANIWNNEINSNDLESVYDSKGNMQNYIAIEQEGNNLVVNNYNDNDNIVASEIIPIENGKYTSEAIKDTIEKVTGLYEQNKTSGTQDKNTIKLSDNEIRNIVKYNLDGREITDQDYVDFMVERYKDNINISGVNTDTKYIKSISDKSKKEKINDLYQQINEKEFKTIKKLNTEDNRIKTIELNLLITKTGLNESFNKGYSNEKYAIVPYLDILIKTSQDGIIRNETKQRENIDEWYYLYNTAIIDNKLYSVKIDIKKTGQGDRFYVHRVNILNKKGNSDFTRTPLEMEKSQNELPLINTSIPQKDTNVKSDTDINNKSMQVDKNYTPNSNIKSMKKNTNNIVTDNQGRQLSKQQQEFFKDSKVRDEKGNLLVVYHGTKNGDFTTFDLNKIGSGATSFSSNGSGFYFTENKKMAQNYAGTIEGYKKTNSLLGLKNEKVNPKVYETYLNITNPFIITDNKNKANNDILTEFSKKIEKNMDNGYFNQYKIYNPSDYESYKALTGADILSNVVQNKGKEFTEFLKNKGFNGIQYSSYSYDINNKINNYIAFDSNQIKNIDNTTPTSNSDIRYMKKSTSNKANIKTSIMNNYDETTARKINFSNRNVIVENNKQLSNLIKEALTTNENKALHLGKLDKSIIDSIKNKIQNLPKNRKDFLKKDTYDLVINQSEIRHLSDKKSSLTNKDIDNFIKILPNIILNSDYVSYTNNLKDEGLRFKKLMEDGTYVSFVVVSNKQGTMKVKTIYMEKGDYQNKKRSISLSNDVNKTPNNTSKTNRAFTSNISIPQNQQNVKNEEVHFNKRTAQNKVVEATQRNAERQDSYIEREIQKIEATGNWDNSIPVTKLTDIRKTIENYLGLGVKKGHFRQHAYAIYKGNRDVIRTKEYKDMDSILHETGHALDIGNRLKVDKESIADELLTAIDKLGGYEQETRSVRLEEGFAEVIREYSVIPKQAKIDYPQTILVLEKLRQNDKSFDNFITKVQQQTYNYIHQNPRNRTLSNISIGEQTDKVPLSKEWVKQETMRNIWDKDYVLKSAVSTLQKVNNKTTNQLKASENAYLLTRLSNGITDKVSSMLSEGYIDENGKKLMPGLNKIGEMLGNDPSRFDDLRTYLVARRDTDYRAKTLKTGLRNNDSLAVIEQFKNDKQIQEASKLIYDTLDGVLQYAVNNGLISQETVNTIKESNAFYVPMQRVLENKGNQIGRKGAVSEIIKQRTGSELDIKDVLENIIANSSNIIQQVENNNVLKALYKQGEGNGITGVIYDVIDAPMIKIGTTKLETWKSELEKQGVDTTNLDLEKTIDLFSPNNKIDTQNLITSFINDDGKRVYLQFNDELLFNSLMNIDKKFMSQVLKINRKMNMPLRFGATMANIGFAIPNMISDTAQAAIYSTAGFIPVVDNALGVLDILTANNKTVRNFVSQVAPKYAEKINELYTIYQQTGATSATRMSQYRESTQNLMKDIYGTKKSENLGIKEKYKPLKRLLDLLTYIPELSEQSTRFRVFERNYDYYKNKGNSEIDTRIMAALESRDATQDFGRTGNLTREINQLIPFSSARVGSAYTFAEKVKTNPKQVTMRIAFLTVLAMTIKALGYDDREIDELNQRKKDDNFVLKIGDNIITIKKPQGVLRSIINLSEYIQDLATGHIEEGKEAKRLEEWLNNAIMDNMPADEVTGLVPNMVAPLIENAINKDFYYNTDIVKSYDLELPNSEQYYEYNSQLAILLGKIFNYSPAKIDNLISSYFGGLGTDTTKLMDYAMGKMGMTAEKPEMGAEDNAIGKRFVVNVNSYSSSIDEIYNRKTELTKKKNGETITDEESKELETITNAISNMSKLNKQIKEIKKDLSMSGKDKADKIKLLQQQKTDTARQALGKSLIYNENKSKIENTQFYPTQNSLSKNKQSLELTSDIKKEYEKIASDYYNKYAKQGIYSDEKLKDIKSKAKDYAKEQLFKKYKNNLVKTE